MWVDGYVILSLFLQMVKCAVVNEDFVFSRFRQENQTGGGGSRPLEVQHCRLQFKRLK